MVLTDLYQNKIAIGIVDDSKGPMGSGAINTVRVAQTSESQEFGIISEVGTMLVLVEARNGMGNRPFRQRPTILAKDGYNFSKSVYSRITPLFLVNCEIEHFWISSSLYYEDDPLPEKQ